MDPVYIFRRSIDLVNRGFYRSTSHRNTSFLLTEEKSLISSSQLLSSVFCYQMALIVIIISVLLQMLLFLFANENQPLRLLFQYQQSNRKRRLNWTEFSGCPYQPEWEDYLKMNSTISNQTPTPPPPKKKYCYIRILTEMPGGFGYVWPWLSS